MSRAQARDYIAVTGNALLSVFVQLLWVKTGTMMMNLPPRSRPLCSSQTLTTTFKTLTLFPLPHRDRTFSWRGQKTFFLLTTRPCSVMSSRTQRSGKCAARQDTNSMCWSVIICHIYYCIISKVQCKYTELEEGESDHVRYY